MPPAPMAETISYGPRRTPGPRDISCGRTRRLYRISPQGAGHHHPGLVRNHDVAAYRVESVASERTCYHPRVPGGRLSENLDAYSRRTIMKDGRRGFVKTAAAAGVGAGLGAIAAMRPAAGAAAETPLQPWWDARPSSAKANRPVAIDLHAHWVPPP